MLDWIYPAGAIGYKIIAPSALKATDGFSRPIPTIILMAGYACSFYCLSPALRTIPMRTVYAIWSGIGIVAISLVGLLLYRQRFDTPTRVGIALIIAGTLVINLP